MLTSMELIIIAKEETTHNHTNKQKGKLVHKIFTP